jgi:hypothetical protein
MLIVRSVGARAASPPLSSASPPDARHRLRALTKSETNEINCGHRSSQHLSTARRRVDRPITAPLVAN